MWMVPPIFVNDNPVAGTRCNPVIHQQPGECMDAWMHGLNKLNSPLKRLLAMMRLYSTSEEGENSVALTDARFMLPVDTSDRSMPKSPLVSSHYGRLIQ
jgi:hypothetical protein